MSSIKIKSAEKPNCSYCSKEISYKKIQLHERLCQNLMTKCKQCNEIVLIEEIEEHMTDFHSSSRQCCNLSKSRSAKKQMSSSIKKSNLKMKEEVACRYCGLTIIDNSNQLLEHEYFCGSKTEECCLCGLLIPKKYYNEHLTTQCIGNSAIKRPKKARQESKIPHSSTKSKNFSNIRRKLLSFDKEIEKKYNNNKTTPLEIPSKIIKRNLFNVTVSRKKKKKKEESNYKIDKYLAKKHLRSSSDKNE